MSAPFQPGERVRITIEGARITDVSFVPDGEIEVAIDSDLGEFKAMLPLTVDITRVAPADWPPLPGDKWRDADGCAWFAIDATDPAFHEELIVELVSASGARYRDLGTALVEGGSWTLAHRDEQTEAPVEPSEELPRPFEKADAQPGDILSDRDGTKFVVVEYGGRLLAAEISQGLTAERVVEQLSPVTLIRREQNGGAQ